jgi:zinc protease
MKNTHSLKQYLFLLPALVSFQLSFSQFALTTKISADPQVKTGKLPNGLVYYIRKNSVPEKKVQLRLVVNAGSVLEDADQQGLAHMMEHMNFNGSTHFPKNELVDYLQSIGVQFGADLNAYTSFDETVYILPIPSDDPVKVDKGFTILEDWAGNALLDSVEINKERGVVLEESRLGKGAGERMSKKYFPKLFNGSKYAERLPIGKDDILSNFKPAVLKRFYQTWYRPNLMAVVVVGDIDPRVAEQQIIKHFSHFKNPATPAPRPAIISIPTRATSESMVLTDKEQPYSVLQIYNYVEKTKAPSTWGDYRQAITELLFSSIINQRLNELTQQKEPPFVFANTGFGSFLRGYRAFTSVAVLGDKPTKTAVDALIGTIESVKKYGFLSSELERTKSSLLNDAESAFKNKDKTESARLVQDYINNYLSGTPFPGIEARYQFMQQVLPGISLQEVNALAKKMESTQGKFVLMTAPEKNADQLPGNQQLLAIVDNAHKLPVKAYEEKTIAKSLIDKMPVAGKVTNQTTNAALGTTDFALSNGVTITLRPTDFKTDEIKMDAWRWGGTRNFGLAEKHNADNATELISAMGVKDMSSIELGKYLAGKTVEVNPYMNPYDEGIEGASSVKDFETFLQLVHLYFTAPRKDETIFQSFIASQKGFVKNLKANPNNYFADTLSKIQYGNNPWARGIPTVEDYDKISLDKVYSIYKSVFSNAYGMHFTFVGNIDVEKVKPLLETYLGSLPAVQKENKFTDEGMRPVKGVVAANIRKGSDKKSLVNVIFTGEAPYSKDEDLKLTVLTEVLNIKIIEQLREAMSGIYGGGMRGGLSNRAYNQYSISLSFPCGPENVEKLTTAALTIIKDAQEKGIEQKDLDKVKATLKQQYDDQLKENDYWLSELSSAWIEKDDPLWLLSYTKKVDAITVQDLQAAAKKYFNMQNYITAVLNPEQLGF